MSQAAIQNQIIEATESVVSFRTTADHPEAQQRCLECIAQMFADDFNATFYTFYGHPALVLSNHDGKDNDVIISGHIDVVPGNDDQFTMKKDNLVLRGRGVFDMKGPLMAAALAARDTVKAGSNKNISLLITIDEETDGRGTKALLDQESYRAKFTLIPDGGSDSKIVIAQKGFLQLAVTISGVSTHASRPWDSSNNPIEKVATLIHELSEQFPVPTDASDWKTSVVPTKIEGGTVLNQIPDSATLYLDVRYVSEEDADSLKQFISEYGADSVEIVEVAGNGMFAVDDSHPELHKLKRSLEKHMDTEVTFSRECGTSDAIFFTEHDIPAALFRPKGGGDHGDEEWVDIVSLEKVYDTVSDYLQSDK